MKNCWSEMSQNESDVPVGNETYNDFLPFSQKGEYIISLILTFASFEVEYLSLKIGQFYLW